VLPEVQVKDNTSNAAIFASKHGYVIPPTTNDDDVVLEKTTTKPDVPVVVEEEEEVEEATVQGLDSVVQAAEAS